ncbi:hypothetical protein N7G274_004579 [Stereocaulon virgatum]|uniref:Uncharacterized protein n=1 Tax=Stereocaulon virgatum TaxID=373712 RepID=A0ABR4ABG4_9LECA
MPPANEARIWGPQLAGCELNPVLCLPPAACEKLGEYGRSRGCGSARPRHSESLSRHSYNSSRHSSKTSSHSGRLGGTYRPYSAVSKLQGPALKSSSRPSIQVASWPSSQPSYPAVPKPSPSSNQNNYSLTTSPTPTAATSPWYIPESEITSEPVTQPTSVAAVEANQVQGFGTSSRSRSRNACDKTCIGIVLGSLLPIAVILGFAFLIRWYMMRRKRRPRTSGEKFTRLTRDVASDLSRSTFSTAVEEPGKGVVGVHNREQLTWWEAAARKQREKWRIGTKSSLQSIQTNGLTPPAPRFQEPLIAGELKRVKSVQHSKSEIQSRDIINVHDVRMSSDVLSILNHAQEEVEIEAYDGSGDGDSNQTQSLQLSKCYTESQYSTGGTDAEISGDSVEDLKDADKGWGTEYGRASWPSGCGWSSFNNIIDNETERRGTPSDSRACGDLRARRFSEDVANPFEDDV